MGAGPKTKKMKKRRSLRVKNDEKFKNPGKTTKIKIKNTPKFEELFWKKIEKFTEKWNFGREKKGFRG